MPIDLWYTDHRNLAQVADFMYKNGDTVENIIYMLEKPWKYDDTFSLSDATLDAEIQALK
jgi:hypothetical protein